MNGIYILIASIKLQCLADLARYGRGGGGHVDERAGIAVATRILCRVGPPVGLATVEGPVPYQPARKCGGVQM